MSPAEVAEVLRLVLPSQNGCGQREVITAFVERDGRIFAKVESVAQGSIINASPAVLRYIEDTDPHYRDYRAKLITPSELVRAVLNNS